MSPRTSRIGLLLMVPALVVTAGCDIFGDYDGCADLNCGIGLWFYVEELTDESGDITCVVKPEESGNTVNPLSVLDDVSQSGTTFSATLARHGTCQTPDGAVSYDERYTFSDGSIVSNEISFDTPTCRFQGTFLGNVIEGSVTCSIPELSGQTVIGTWRAKVFSPGGLW